MGNMQIPPNAATMSSEILKLRLVCVIPLYNELLLFSETLWACVLKFFRVTCIFRFSFGQFAAFSPRLTATTCSVSAGF